MSTDSLYLALLGFSGLVAGIWVAYRLGQEHSHKDHIAAMDALRSQMSDHVAASKTWQKRYEEAEKQILYRRPDGRFERRAPHS